MRLLERSTRNLRLTDIGVEVLEYAQRIAELSEAVDALVSNQLSTVAGVLRLSAPLSVSDTCSPRCSARSGHPIRLVGRAFEQPPHIRVRCGCLRNSQCKCRQRFFRFFPLNFPTNWDCSAAPR